MVRNVENWHLMLSISRVFMNVKFILMGHFYFFIYWVERNKIQKIGIQDRNEMKRCRFYCHTKTKTTTIKWTKRTF